jgi:hypothetical protein
LTPALRVSVAPLTVVHVLRVPNLPEAGLMTEDLAEKDAATCLAHSMKRSTTGLGVRFFKITAVTGQGRGGRSTGKTFKEKRSP